MVEVVARLSADRDPQPALFGLLLRALQAMDGGRPARVAVCFALRAVDLLGHRPRIDRCMSCGRLHPFEDPSLDVAAGGLVCAACRPGADAIPPSGALVGTLKRLRSLSWTRPCGSISPPIWTRSWPACSKGSSRGSWGATRSRRASSPRLDACLRWCRCPSGELPIAGVEALSIADPDPGRSAIPRPRPGRRGGSVVVAGPRPARLRADHGRGVLARPRHQFVDWDDPMNLVDNPDFRGLGWQNLRWMFTTTLAGHWIPVTWISFGVDYRLWGMNPLGYHLTNVLLHAASAVAFYFVALRLLRVATGAGERVLRSGRSPPRCSSRSTRCGWSRSRGRPSGATCSPGCGSC